PFRSLADLDSVPGVGPALLESLEPHLTLPARNAAVARRPAAPARKPEGSRTRGEASGPLELNRATEAELTALPGIGPALARRIVALREEQGRFRSVEDLEKVVGIGPSLLERLR